ncbi:MAG: ABC transporter substrate-binding protein [Oscillospiraceae bacterium]|nr:ABC transporter substrate-binding protein [Oscillospiraceae bacterium]
MKNLKPIALALCLILLAPLFAFAESAPAIAVTDMAGRAVALDKPASRVVALTASDCEIVYALGAGDALVGRGEYCDYPAEVLAVPSVESGYETNIEQIIALEPQVVLMNTMAQTQEHAAALEAAGIAAVVSNASDIAGVYESIKLIGALLGKAEEADAIVESMREGFAEIASNVPPDAAGKSVYFEVSPLEHDLWTAGAGTFMDELASLVGLTNAFADVQGWAEISEEQVIARDPDIIITVSMYYGEGPTPVEEIMSRAGWQNLKALVNGDILNADSNEISRPAPRLLDAARTLYEFVYADQAEEPAA